jgi:hypothetical protein
MIMEHLEKYNQRYLEFARITPINFEDRVNEVPEEKHYWVTELTRKEHEKRTLLKAKKRIKDALTQKIIDEGIVSLNKSTLDNLENSGSLDDINEKLADVESAIIYLERIVKNVTFIGQDIKNILAWKQLSE